MFDYERIAEDPKVVDPEGPVLIRLDVGGMNNRQMVKMVEGLKVRIGDGTRYHLESQDFETLSERQSRDMIKMRLSNLDFKGRFLAYSEILKRAKFFGYKECPSETPMELFLNKVEAISSEPIFVATKPIYNSEKIPSICRVNFLDRSIMLTSTSKFGGRGWTENDQFMFMIPREIGGLMV